MQVALLTSASDWRGSGVSYAEIARGLIDRGHGVRVVTASPRLTARLTELGLPVSQLPVRHGGPRNVWALWRILRRFRSQVILADTPRDVRISACVTLLYRAPIVYRYNLAYRGSRPRLVDRLYMRRVAACIFQSRFIRREAYSHLPPLRNLPSKRVPNGYDTAFFAPDTHAGLEFRKRFGIAPGTDVVLTSAKLARNKGHKIALEALNLVRRDGADLVYVMCGDGPKEEQLRAHADRLSLPTIFTGLLDADAMIGALSAADVVVHPSLREVLPNAVGEAMSCSRAVVAADAGGTDELLGRDGATGILVPAGDVESLADAVRLLLADRQLREEIGTAARRLIEQRFPLRRMIDGYEEGLAGPVRERG